MANSSLPVDLRRAAVTVSDAAAELSTAARTLLGSWSEARWSGSGADAARARLTDALAQVTTAVERVDDVAVLARRAADGATSPTGSVLGG